MKSGGYGEHISAYMESCHPGIRVLPIAIWDRFVEQGEIAKQKINIGLSPEAICQAIEETRTGTL